MRNWPFFVAVWFGSFTVLLFVVLPRVPLSDWVVADTFVALVVGAAIAAAAVRLSK